MLSIYFSWEWTGTVMCQTQHDLSTCSVLSDLSGNTLLATNTLGLAVCLLTCVAAQDRPHTAPWLLWCRRSPPTSLLPLLRGVGGSVSRPGSVTPAQAEPRPAPGAGGRAAPSFAARKPREGVGTTVQGELPRLFRRWRQKQGAGERGETDAAQGTGVVLAVNNGVTKSSLQISVYVEKLLPGCKRYSFCSPSH